MKKILWFSNYRFSNVQDCSTGTWIGSMGRAIAMAGKYEIYNITAHNVNGIVYEECNGLKQWILPNWKLNKIGLPNDDHIREILAIVNNISPDLVHVWGFESYFGLLISRKIISCNNLLDVQGICHVISRFSTGYMSPIEQISTLGPMEILRCSGIFSYKRKLRVRRELELEMMHGFDNISYQSQYVKDWLRVYGTTAHLHPTGIMLRKEFMEARRWNYDLIKKNPIQIFVTSNSVNPGKGLMVVIEAVALLKSSMLIPGNFRLRVVGSNGIGRHVILGYTKWLRNKARKLDVLQNIDFLGMMNGEKIVKEMQDASVFVCPSFTETYSLSAAEGLVVGVPAVLSYAGAIPELASNRESALFYPAGDVGACAMRIFELLHDKELCCKLSANSIRDGFQRNDPQCVLKRQCEIYEHCLRRTI